MAGRGLGLEVELRLRLGLVGLGYLCTVGSIKLSHAMIPGYLRRIEYITLK